MASQGILVVVLVLVLVLLLLLPASAFASNFWYLNCGSSEGFTGTANITWIGDEQFVKSGESVVINDGGFYNGSSMRAFPKMEKNCYTIPVGRDIKVQVTVAFYYGNYDGKNNPPTFGLMFDTTDWATVNLTGYQEGAIATATAIYVTRRNDTNICFGRLYEDQDPVVFSVQLSVLGRDMYSRVNSSYALSLPYRYAFGANSTFRYPDDDYDRYWYPTDSDINIAGNYVNLTSNSTTITVNTSSIIDQPPAKMFRTAIAPAPPANNLSITTTFLFSDPTDIYLNMYFSEISINKTRSFHIYMDDNIISNGSNPISPPFGEAVEFTASFLQATENTAFTLVPANDSILPPIISGLEVLLIRSFSRRATDSRDVNGSTILQENFDILNNWTGDPCLPLKFNWEWVNCSSDDSPRITSLSLGGFGLSGTLPDFSILDALETIDLQNNNLTGRIPEFLAELPKLQLLNLAYNSFSSIPSSLVNNTRIRLNITGNPLLDTSSTPSPPTTMNEPPSSMTEPPPSPPPPKNGCKGAYGLAFSLHMLMLVVVIIF